MNYKEKYIKYKNKYINLKNELNQSGGAVSPITVAKAALLNPSAAIALATGSPDAALKVGKAVFDPKNAGLVDQAVKDVTGSPDAAKMATNAAATIQNAANSANIDPTKIAQQAQQLATSGASLDQVKAAATAAGTNLAQQATTAGTAVLNQATTTGTAALNQAQSAATAAGTKAVAPVAAPAIPVNVTDIVNKATAMGTNLLKTVKQTPATPATPAK